MRTFAQLLEAWGLAFVALTQFGRHGALVIVMALGSCFAVRAYRRRSPRPADANGPGRAR